VFDGQFVFSQVLDFLPRRDFNACVERYRGNYKSRGFSCRDQFLAMAFAQLTYRESLRDIEICLRALGTKLYHAGFRSRISRSTMADANQRRDWRIYADFAHILIRRSQACQTGREKRKKHEDPCFQGLFDRGAGGGPGERSGEVERFAPLRPVRWSEIAHYD